MSEMSPSEPIPSAELPTESPLAAEQAPPAAAEIPSAPADVPPQEVATSPMPAASSSVELQNTTAPALDGEKPSPRASHSAPPLPSQPVPIVPPTPQPHDLSRVAQDLQIRKAQVEAVVQLLDEDNTVPFITRYRKERTGGLNEEAIRRIQERIAALRGLNDRKQTVLKSIAYQGKLNDDLVRAILAADFPKRLEDLYLPFKPKKKSLAADAREKGLEPAALAIWSRDAVVGNLPDLFAGLVDPDKWLLNPDEVATGVRFIIADLIADSADVRGPLRAFIWDTGLITSIKVEGLPEGKGKEFEPYANFREPVRDIPPHRVLAINRGEKEQVLRLKLDIDSIAAKEIAIYHLGLDDHPHREFLFPVLDDALSRLVLPSLEREVRRELTERAQDHAVLVFARNLRSLLLQPPLRGKRVLAIDPGLRTGCKVAVLDETGLPLEDAVVYPHPPQKKAADAKRKLEQLIRKHSVPVIAIGNGTGCRETEQLVADLIADLENRRLNPALVVPQAVAPPVTAVVSEAPTHSEAVVSEIAQPHPAPIVDQAAPAAESPAPEPKAAEAATAHIPPITIESFNTSGTIVSGPVPYHQVSTITFDLPSHEATAAETTGASPPAGETVTTAAITANPTHGQRNQHRQPEISLEGLPDAPIDLAYVIVIEAGASDYSASPVAREEFPTLDATTRGTISIGRRLQDPLAELVKIDPQHVGVGLYQHDVKAKHLKESLEAVIESSVNQVGVDLNTASVPLLRHVSGMNQLVAREVVEYRNRHGAFRTREQLKDVPNLGEKRFTQAAGFLKISPAEDPLDTTWIHPESYPTARQILTDLGFAPADLLDKARLEELRAQLVTVNPEMAAEVLQVGSATIHDILDALAKPGRDPREDLPPPIFKKGILKIEDIHTGMELKGTVLNVVPFGAFVDIGLKESGLVHISQMANRYIKSPYDVVAVGDVVNVWVIEVKTGEKKISLSMISPGQERGKPERGPRGERSPDQGDRPAPQPRSDRGDRGDRGERPPQQRGDRPAFQPRQDGPTQRQGQGQRGGGGPPNQDRGRGPAQGGRGPAPAGRGPSHQDQRPTHEGQQRGQGQPQDPRDNLPPPPPRKPSKPKPLPNLTQDKKTGKAALNTFAELAAFFIKEEPKPVPPPEVKEDKPPEG